MIKSYKSFSELKTEFENIYANIDKKYIGHTHWHKNDEPLSEHISKTVHYFHTIVNVHDLEEIIDNIIFEIAGSNYELGNFIKILFYNSIIFHDFGKINPNFQNYIGNKEIKWSNSIKIGKEHSFLSAYIFLNYFTGQILKAKQFKNRDAYLAYGFIFLFSLPILKHHSSFIEKDIGFDQDKIKSIHDLISFFNIQIPLEKTSNLIEHQDKIWTEFDDLDVFSIFVLLKLNYSLLTAVDFYATTEYINDIKFQTKQDFGLITKDIKQKLQFNIKNKKKYNGDLIDNLEYYLNYSTQDLQITSYDNLNILRQKLGAEVLSNIKNHRKEKIFYIEAPTGSGKTNMSMLAVWQMLQLFPKINKVFYVFPFTTLITQTAKAIKETLGLTYNEIAQVHSKAGFQKRNYKNNEIDAHYGKKKRNEIDNIFVNYPFILLTHIKFFNILKSNEKKSNYLLHRLANSIVIIDELQSYNPREWDKIKYFIANYSKLFNVRFILMSATLPKLDELKLPGKPYKLKKQFVSLIREPEKYLQNPNFSKRVKIKTGLLEEKDLTLEKLAEKVLQKSKEYSSNRTDEYQNSIYTIIEFIFKITKTNTSP